MDSDILSSCQAVFWHYSWQHLVHMQLGLGGSWLGFKLE